MYSLAKLYVSVLHVVDPVATQVLCYINSGAFLAVCSMVLVQFGVWSRCSLVQFALCCAWQCGAVCSTVQCALFSLQCTILFCVQAMGFAMIASPSSARRQQSLLGANNQRSNPPNHHCEYTYGDKVHT